MLVNLTKKNNNVLLLRLWAANSPNLAPPGHTQFKLESPVRRVC